MENDVQQNPPQQTSPIAAMVERIRSHPIAFAFVCLGIIFFLYQAIGGTITLVVVGSKVTPENVGLHRIFTGAGQILFILIPTLLFAKLMRENLSVVFPSRMPQGMETLFAILGLLFLQSFLQSYMALQDLLPFAQELKKYIEPLRKMMEEIYKVLISAESIPELLFVLLIVAIVPGIIEELLFRGVIQSSFERRMSPLAAAAFAGAIFGAFHFNPIDIVPLMLLGCYFGILRWRSRSIILAMTAHFLNNALAVLANYYHLDQESVVGTAGTAELSLTLIVTQFFFSMMMFGISFHLYLRFSGDERIHSA
ncbi:MAG: type II CAAX endopeptidase family protein [bacterium]